MKVNIMKSRVALIATAACLTASVAAAQQAAPVPVQDPAPNQVENFEKNLRNAIDSAASKLAQRVRTTLPNYNFTFQYSAPPIVTGAMVPDAGAVFHVLIPAAITDVDLMLLRAYEARVPTRPVSSTSSTIEAPLPLANPNDEYTTLVKTSLYDAVLDSAMLLPIPAGQRLTIIADELQTQPANPFNPRSRSLILQIKGEDLIALRENRINREEARARIKESRFPN